MRTLRRPMFRKGGEVGGGIMTGVMRENYAVGSARERLARVAAEYPSTAVDPLSQFLIQGGLNLASQPASGSGVIADAAAAFKEPTAGLFKGLAEKGQMGKRLALEGEILDIEAEQAEKLARIKNQNKDFFAAQTPEAQFQALLTSYEKSTIPVVKNNARDLAAFRIRHKNQPYFELDYEYSNQTKKFEPNFNSIPPGAITFDVSEGKAFRRNKDGSFTELDPINLNPLEPIDGTE